MTVRPNRPPLPRMAVWSAGLGVAGSVLAIALLAWGMSDVDGDGAASFQEMGAGTMPMRADSDGDGWSDGWEFGHGMDPLAAEPASPLANDPLCGLGLQDCPEPEEVPAEATPTVRDSTAQIRTGVVAFVAAAVAALAGITTSRIVARR